MYVKVVHNKDNVIENKNNLLLNHTYHELLQAPPALLDHIESYNEVRHIEQFILAAKSTQG
jgi:hypothetical protein